MNKNEEKFFNCLSSAKAYAEEGKNELARECLNAADTAAFIAFYKRRYENLKVARDLIKEVKSAF